MENLVRNTLEAFREEYIIQRSKSNPKELQKQNFMASVTWMINYLESIFITSKSFNDDSIKKSRTTKHVITFFDYLEKISHELNEVIFDHLEKNNSF